MSKGFERKSIGFHSIKIVGWGEQYSALERMNSASKNCLAMKSKLSNALYFKPGLKKTVANRLGKRPADRVKLVADNVEFETVHYSLPI